MTQYIHCGHCFKAAKTLLVSHDKYLCSVTIPAWDGTGELPIIAGKLGGLYDGEEIDSMEQILSELHSLLCAGHSITVAVLSDSKGSAILDSASCAAGLRTFGPEWDAKTFSASH